MFTFDLSQLNLSRLVSEIYLFKKKEICVRSIHLQLTWLSQIFACKLQSLCKF